MESEVERKILGLLDVISVEVAANRNETSLLRTEMRAGFDRIDRRVGNVETRVENVETRVENLGTNVAGVRIDLRLFRGEFDRRIAPLER